MKISVVLLAAGNSTRFEKNKLLSELGGKKIITYALDVIKQCVADVVTQYTLEKVIVVTQYDEVGEIAAQYGYTCVKNDCPEMGISHSLQLGLDRCKDADAVLFMVCDQPFITAETLNKMLRQADDRHILRCCYHSQKGNPTLFPKCYFEELLQLKGDIGGRTVMKKHPESVREIEVCDAKELVDIDTQKELKYYSKER